MRRLNCFTVIAVSFIPAKTMARRMFSPKIIDTDNFLDMPVSARELYFQFGMRADDDGFVANPKRVMRMIGSTDDDFKVLTAKDYIIPFKSGVVVITSWHINNLVRKDWYRETECKREKRLLALREGKYKLVNETTSKSLTQVRLGKDRLGKDRVREIPPSSIMVEKIKNWRNNKKKYKELIQTLKNKGVKNTEREVNKFFNYWTELNKSGLKQRWELQPTFEFKRRLENWVNKRFIK